MPSKELDEQIEEDYNKLLDACSNFRDNLGEVADNISLGVPLQQFWEDTCAERASAVHGPYISNEGDPLQKARVPGISLSALQPPEIQTLSRAGACSNSKWT